MKKLHRDAGAVWPEPTRRTFVGMLGAAAAVLALPKAVRMRSPEKPIDPPPLPRWIGHL